MRDDDISEEELDDARFWADLHGIKDIEIKTVRQWLESGGYKVDPHPPDEELAKRLSTLIDALSSIGVFVTSTDHLSDRQLYEFLFAQLGGHMALLPNSSVVIDVIGGGSEEDNRLYLRYYATDEDRARWKEQFPEYELPPRQSPPYDRDRSLL